MYPAVEFSTILPNFVIAYTKEKISANFSSLLPAVLERSPIVILVVQHISRNIQMMYIGCLTCSSVTKRFLKLPKEVHSKVTFIECVPIHLLSNETNMSPVKFELLWSQLNFPFKSFQWIESFILPDLLPVQECMPNRRNKYNINTSSKILTEHKCAIDVYSSMRNCSSSCNRYIKFQMPFMFATYDSFVLPKVLSFGTQTDRVQFFVMLDLHEANNSLQMLAIVSPFPPTIWVTFTVIFLLYIVLALQLFGGEINRIFDFIFVMLSIIFEQDVSMKFLGPGKNAIISLIAGWSYGMMFLRMLYTSELYTGLTKGYEPKNVPENFEDIFHVKKAGEDSHPYHVFSDIVTTSLTVNSIGEIRFSKLKEIQTSFTDKVKVLASNISPEHFIYNVSTGKDIHCSNFVDKLNFKNCPTNGRVVQIYSTVGWEYSFKTRFLKHAIKSLGKRQVIEFVNQPPLQTETLAWFAVHEYFFLRDIENVIARLVESGIYNKFKVVYDAVHQKQVDFRVHELDKHYTKHFSDDKPTNNTEAKDLQSHGVKMYAVKPVLVLYFFLVFVTGLTFSAEYLCKMIKSRLE